MTSTPSSTDRAKDSASGSLTERYVHAATRRLDATQRDDVALELRGDIADRVDTLRATQPSLSAATAEELALLELGNPDDLAARYSDAPQHLIGPVLYATYVRTLRVVLVSVVPIVTVVLVVLDAVGGASPGELLGTAIGAVFTLVVQIFFWMTVVFAIVERTTDDRTATESLGLAEWSPDQLPELPRAGRGSLAETITNVVWLALLAGATVWQQLASPLRVDGERVPVLDPDLWSFWLPVVLVALALEALFEVVKYRAGGLWSIRFAALNTVTGLLFAAPLAWLAWQERLLNPDLVGVVQQDWPGFDPGITHTVILATVIGIWLLDSFDGWRKALARP